LVRDFRVWPHSSYHAFSAASPTLISRDKVLTWFGGKANFEAAHRRVGDTPLEDFDLE
jgi:hypothetical protein